LIVEGYEGNIRGSYYTEILNTRYERGQTRNERARAPLRLMADIGLTAEVTEDSAEGRRGNRNQATTLDSVTGEKGWKETCVAYKKKKQVTTKGVVATCSVWAQPCGGAGSAGVTRYRAGAAFWAECVPAQALRLPG
jgi:hypothetical protein